MKINDRAITEQLEEIRRKVGGKPVGFIPRPFPNREDKDLTTPQEVQALFHSSGLLVEAGRPVFAYIRDHTLGYSQDPAERNKVHFMVCQKLRDMKERGRFARRYRLTHRDSNAYLVDVSAGWGRSKELDGQTLYPCKHCLAMAGYHCYDTSMTEHAKNAIVRKFDAKEAYRLLWRYFDAFRRETSPLPPATKPTGYPKNWRKISANFRKWKNHTCENPKCGVNLSEYKHLTDAHHLSGDKSDVRHDNLRCLCKLCHADEHPHYAVHPYDRRVIMEERAQQGIVFAP